MKNVVILFCVTLLALTTASSYAADTRWFGSGEDWSDTDFWVGEQEPTINDSCQIDGTVQVTYADEIVGRGFYVGRYSGQNATVRVISGDLTTSYYGDQISFFGYSGTGNLEMVGGTYEINYLTIFGYNSLGNGVCTIEGGLLDISSIRIGEDGTGHFTQTGGTLEAGGITLGYGDGSFGTYEISGGTLTPSAFRFGSNRFNISNPTFDIQSRSADITINYDFSFYAPDSVFLAVPGAKIKFVGEYAAFNNELNVANEANVEGLKNLTMEFSDNSTSTYGTYEVACEDLGSDVAGFCGGNFTMNTLAVGGDTPAKVQLVDNFDNGNRGTGSECLYVRKLIVTAGSSLDLNGLNLYYQEAEINGPIDGSPQKIWMLDMNDDGIVADYELATVAEYWLDETCACPDLCGGADLDTNGMVDMFDLAIVLNNWLSTNSTKFYEETFDSDPGWTTQGQWEFGVPLGSGGEAYGNADPTSGFTGTNVYGINLAGNYSISTSPYYKLETTTIDCTGRYGVELRYKRWLNSQGWGQPSHTVLGVNNVLTVFDGSYERYVWYNTNATITDSDWVDCSYDISEWADNNPNVKIVWKYRINSSAVPYSGWNIDDVELWGSP